MIYNLENQTSLMNAVIICAFSDDIQFFLAIWWATALCQAGDLVFPSSMYVQWRVNNSSKKVWEETNS